MCFAFSPWMESNLYEFTPRKVHNNSLFFFPFDYKETIQLCDINGLCSRLKPALLNLKPGEFIGNNGHKSDRGLPQTDC